MFCVSGGLELGNGTTGALRDSNGLCFTSFII